MSETDCVFCKLISGELEVSVIHQDDLCLAFMDIQPVNPGHALGCSAQTRSLSRRSKSIRLALS